MATPTEDPLARALPALERLSGADLSPVAAEVFQVVRDAALETQSRQNDLLAVAREARAFLAILEGYNAALEGNATELIAELADTAETAEAALAQAVSRIQLAGETGPPLPGEAAFLSLLDRLNGGSDEDNEKPIQ